ncbi:interaptin [Impatiens glandulifera]|uniref:interaptin n=1 Tax=Impatiens glandulifera TaxID=253017 RepID=UPI001FB0678D|nr:interaptin [Impatiens glandulifera]
MFSSRWRSEKNKIKAVFKLQFQATQVPKLKKKALMISLVPADIQRPTVKLEKAAIVNGSCYWETPVYETVKLTRETKTGRINEKAYHFVVSTGSSKSGFLGSACLNFADFLEEEEDKPLLVSLSLYGYNQEEISTMLLVTIQKMEGPDHQRCIEAIEDAIDDSQDRMVECKYQDTDENATLNFVEATRNEEHGRISTNPQYAASNYMHQRSNTDGSLGSASDGSTFDSINSSEEMLLEETPPRESETEISRLQRHAEVMDLEVQALRKQIVKEGKREQELSRHILSLKAEHDALEEEYDQLKSMLNTEVPNQLKMEIEQSKFLLEELRKELNHEKDLNGTLRFQLKKTEDSNSKLIFALRDVEEILEQKNGEMVDLYAKEKPNSTSEDAPVEILKQEILDLHNEMEVCKRETEEVKLQREKLVMESETLKKENLEISQKLEQNLAEEVKMQNECLQYFKTAEDHALEVERLEKKIKKQALELSVSSSTIIELQNQAKDMEKELIRQAQGFEEALEGITRAKVEQEHKAIKAEDVLRKTKWNNVIIVQRIQEEFKRISLGMETKVNENEKLATRAVMEANDLRLQKEALEEMLQKANKELRHVNERFSVLLQDVSNETDTKRKQIDQMKEELKEKCLQIENLQKHVEEIQNAFSLESQILRDEMEKIKMENRLVGNLEEQGRYETEYVKKSIDVQELQQSWSEERNKLKRELDLVRKEAQKLEEESKAIRPLKDENEIRIKNLLSDIEAHQSQHSQLKHQLAEEEMKNENLKKEVFRLESYVQGKENNITVDASKSQAMEEGASPDTEKVALNNKGSALLVVNPAKLHGSGSAKNVAADIVKFGFKNPMMGCMEQAANISIESEPGTCSGKELNLSISTVGDQQYNFQLLHEVTQIKEKNKSMEIELKEMQERYSEISLKFAEVEGERQQLVMTLRNLKNGKKT